jgi:poly(3-hydroxybutyrate) depolymerase
MKLTVLLRCLLISLTLWTGAACATPANQAGAPTPLQEKPAVGAQSGDVRTFTFSGWGGPRIPVWSYRPAAAGPEAPVLLVFHGVRRDADRYLREWIPVAEAWGVVVACPEFTAEAFPGALSYNLGGVLDENDQPRPRALWAFSAIEPLFQALALHEGLRTARVHIYGHSAGAQFVHRLMMFAPPASADRVIIANAGWYTRPRTDIAWPYGLRGAPITQAQIENFLKRDITVLLGDADNDPQHPSLNREPNAMAQGPHRLARGELYFSEAGSAARTLDVSFGWRKSYAPGIGHDNGKMATFAAELLFKTPAKAPAR